MTYEDFNAYCHALTATSYVVQWGGSHVWKVGGEVFSIGGWADKSPAFTFKVSDISFELLKEQPGLRPAPYLASRGMKWIQHYAEPGLVDDELRDYIRQSHRLSWAAEEKATRIGAQRTVAVHQPSSSYNSRVDLHLDSSSNQIRCDT